MCFLGFVGSQMVGNWIWSALRASGRRPWCLRCHSEQSHFVLILASCFHWVRAHKARGVSAGLRRGAGGAAHVRRPVAGLEPGRALSWRVRGDDAKRARHVATLEVRLPVRLPVGGAALHLAPVRGG